MFRVVRMMLADILVLDRHIHSLTVRLAESGKIELVPSEHGARRHEKELARLSAFISRPARILKESGIAHRYHDASSMGLAEAERIIQSFLDRIEPLKTQLGVLRSRLTSLAEALPGVHSLRELDVSLNELGSLEHIILQYGSIPTGESAALVSSAGSGSVILPLSDTPGENSRQRILAASSKTGRFALETLLGEHGFVREEIPSDERSGSELVGALESEMDTTRAAIVRLEAEYDSVIHEQLPHLDEAISQLEREQKILSIINGLPQTESTARIRCWVARSDLPELSRLVDEVTQNTAVIETLDPIKLPASQRQSLSIPVILRNSVFFKPFESLIANYGYPAYGEIEPTPLVAIGFILMFGVMFGDLGQGLVLVLAGLGISLIQRFSPALRQAGMLIASAGLSAAFFGLVFGSFFCL